MLEISRRRRFIANASNSDKLDIADACFFVNSTWRKREVGINISSDAASKANDGSLKVALGHASLHAANKDGISLGLTVLMTGDCFRQSF